MNGIARGAEDTGRLALALLLALGLHAALLLGIPAEGWSLRYAPPPRFDVTLLPPIERPNPPAPTAAAPKPTESAAVVVPEPALPPMEPPPAAPASPAPTFTPPAAPIPPPKPVTTVRPAPKPVIAARPAPKPVITPPASAQTGRASGPISQAAGGRQSHAHATRHGSAGYAATG